MPLSRPLLPPHPSCHPGSLPCAGPTRLSRGGLLRAAKPTVLAAVGSPGVSFLSLGVCKQGQKTAAGGCRGEGQAGRYRQFPKVLFRWRVPRPKTSS